MSNYATAIGLDVHARSIKACALNPMTGEVERASFGYDPVSVAEWVLGFEEPRAVYESGVTGFHLCRALRALGVDCVVGAVSKMQRPAADRGRKTDRRDAEWLARLLATRNVVEVWVPDGRTEAARDELARKVAESAGRPEWKPIVDALRCVKGIDVATAFLLACEAGDFSRFPTAPSFASWCGLTPSEHSSGESASRGGITRAGNAHVRWALVEASWHVPTSSREPKPLAPGQEASSAVRRHATKCNRRLQDRREAMEASGKRPVVANCATAREMACWVWAIARMAGA